MDVELLTYIDEQLEVIKEKCEKLNAVNIDICTDVMALKETINHFNSEKEEKDEEPTIEDEIMSCLKDLINNNDLFKDVKIKVVKVDEDDA